VLFVITTTHYLFCYKGIQKKIKIWAQPTGVGLSAVAFLCCIGATTQKELQQMPQSLARGYLRAEFLNKHFIFIIECNNSL